MNSEIRRGTGASVGNHSSGRHLDFTLVRPQEEDSANQYPPPQKKMTSRDYEITNGVVLSC